ncbi:MAG: thioredoxin-disulfide reductase [Actinobacteria bacterium HGW-Actinobacteria-1]|jgi:thioredoxin reductase (NADPH)|nr:MAG: thioredoxin-disulfide reductase [Actinobacteria bacterium HGW-Actinobacteria-1]
MPDQEIIDIAIIGGGPAGLTAALYSSRARAKTVVFESGLPGGQIVTTDWVENYPGFPDGISGMEIGDLMHRQAEKFGAEFRTFAAIEKIEPQGIDFLLTDSEGAQVVAHAVILATGAVPKRLGVPGEAEFTGRGVSWCATCDGAFFRDKVVAVIGGGDAAVEEALFLTKFASKVHIVHRRDELRATKCIQEKCFANEKIAFELSRVVSEVVGENGKVTGIKLASTKGDPELLLPLDGVFIFVGVEPKSELVADLCDLDQAGYIKIDHNGLTSYPGLYAAGDVTDSDLKQVITAAAKGASAAFEALRWIDERLCSI